MRRARRGIQRVIDHSRDIHRNNVSLDFFPDLLKVNRIVMEIVMRLRKIIDHADIGHSQFLQAIKDG